MWIQGRVVLMVALRAVNPKVGVRIIPLPQKMYEEIKNNSTLVNRKCCICGKELERFSYTIKDKTYCWECANIHVDWLE